MRACIGSSSRRPSRWPRRPDAPGRLPPLRVARLAAPRRASSGRASCGAWCLDGDRASCPWPDCQVRGPRVRGHGPARSPQLGRPDRQWPLTHAAPGASGPAAPTAADAAPAGCTSYPSGDWYGHDAGTAGCIGAHAARGGDAAVLAGTSELARQGPLAVTTTLTSPPVTGKCRPGRRRRRGRWQATRPAAARAMAGRPGRPPNHPRESRRRSVARYLRRALPE
jgi:hypothetical protein